jgi:hypothetical protein
MGRYILGMIIAICLILWMPGWLAVPAERTVFGLLLVLIVVFVAVRLLQTRRRLRGR